MLEFAEDYPDVALALPIEPREILKLHRDYISTLIYTLVGDEFSDWVEEQTKTRNKYVEDKKDTNVHLDPDIARILQASTSISVTKGISNNLLKVS